MFGINKNTKETVKQQVEFYLTVGMELYAILVLAYGALATYGYLPVNDFSRKVLAISLGVFCLVRLAVAIARGRRVVK